MDVYTDRQQRILNDLTAEIGQQAKQCAEEQIAPRHEADEMDAYIKKREENVAALRSMREDLENIFTGMCS